MRVVYRWPAGIVENGSTTLGDLPFQGVAGQSLRRCPLPDETPKIFIAFSALPSLNPLRHILKLIPCFRRPSVAVLLQQVDPVKEEAFAEVVRQSHKSAVYGVVLDEFREVG